MTHLDSLFRPMATLKMKISKHHYLRGDKGSRHSYVLHHRHILSPLDLLKVLTRVIVETYLNHLSRRSVILRLKVSIRHCLRGDPGSRHPYTVPHRHTPSVLELLSNLTSVIIEAYLDTLWE